MPIPPKHQEWQRAYDYFTTRQAKKDLRAAGIPTLEIHKVEMKQELVRGFLGLSSSWHSVETLVGTVRGWLLKYTNDESEVFTALPDASYDELHANGFSTPNPTLLFHVTPGSSGYVYTHDVNIYTHVIVECEAAVKRLLGVSQNSGHHMMQDHLDNTTGQEYFVSGTARKALAAAGAARVTLYRENYRRLVPGRFFNTDEPEVEFQGYGWILGTFTWITPVYASGRWESRPVSSLVALSTEPATDLNPRVCPGIMRDLPLLMSLQKHGHTFHCGDVARVGMIARMHALAAPSTRLWRNASPRK